MSGKRLRTVFARVQPAPRLVDWSLFVLVGLEVASGLLSFTVGRPSGWPVFEFHRIAGVTIVALLAFKLYRVRRRILDRDRWMPSTAVSVLTAVAALGALSTGFLWVAGLDVRIAYWTLLSVHVGFGLALVPLLIAHLSTRFRPPRRVDFEGRRTAVRFAGLVVASAVVLRLQRLANAVLETGGSDRRFTGSQPREGAGNAAFPVTSWVADDPDPIDRDAWALSVDGLVASPIDLEFGALEPDAEREALLDCTSGWYTVQRWSGIRVGDLLERVDAEADATHVRFVSVTGYRWTLPIEEARDAVLATHVGGERLSHGHGGPLRLVAPGRRGFQWVKWVDRVEVRDRPDPAQWLVTLISGFD
ncbi:molybdopterin-dependent oxidoreductase [Natrinema longum]|uniref:Molybdopterin-dependent oxidoreductase n=1 Tax=Natrinema longum TaxID=370324 RepID=A0A8A2U777_9EURY|nr:molybdopterin-dependent oxidoreductase [Natrinema longum]MBZ6494913.1 molybdopterin-dependent oxidoreductase [Natrinema longum]QSW83788.1 molybdopterin-dependent oxidoreductase [Natrinema longum]